MDTIERYDAICSLKAELRQIDEAEKKKMKDPAKIFFAAVTATAVSMLVIAAAYSIPRDDTPKRSQAEIQRCEVAHKAAVELQKKDLSEKCVQHNVEGHRLERIADEFTASGDIRTGLMFLRQAHKHYVLSQEAYRDLDQLIEREAGR